MLSCKIAITFVTALEFHNRGLYEVHTEMMAYLIVSAEICRLLPGPSTPKRGRPWSEEDITRAKLKQDVNISRKTIP